MKRIGPVALLLALAAPATAGWHLSQVLHKDEKKIGRTVFPATETGSEIWYANDKVATVTELGNTVFDFARQKAFVVDHVNRRFVVTALPIDPSKTLEKQAIKATAQRSTTVTVTPNGETRKIKEWSCARYDVVLVVTITGKMFGKTHIETSRTSMVMWTTQDIPIDPATYRQTVATQWRLMLFDEATAAELARIPGYPVLVESRSECLIKDGKPEWVETSRVELTGAAQAEVPPEVLAIPEGYTRREIFDPREIGIRWLWY
jgi:hypothetical protein